MQNEHIPKVTQVSLSEINPSPENDRLYRPISQNDPEIIELAKSIAQHGLKEPIVISADNWILSGHRRFAACCRLKMDEVPVRIEPIRREDDIDAFVVLLREFNRQRDKTLDERLREELVSVDSNAAYRSLVEHRSRADHLETPAFKITGAVRRRRISKAKQPMLDKIKEVIQSRKKFWPLSDRQIHYALLNDPPLKHASKPNSRYDNSKASYGALTELLTRARLEDQISFAAIADSTRPVTTWNVFESTRPYIRKEFDGLFKGYYRDIQISQPDHIELVIEKNTLQSIVRPIAAEFRVPMTSGRGYCSLSPRHAIAGRFQRSGKYRLVLVIISDFDPDGEEISQSMARSMRDDFGIDNIHPVKAALTREQTQQLKLPTALKAKPKSPNYKKFVDANGSDDCWEVEALAPEQLQDIVRETLNGLIDVDRFNEEIDQEKRDAAHLAATRKAITKSLGDLSIDFDADQDAEDLGQT